MSAAAERYEKTSVYKNMLNDILGYDVGSGITRCEMRRQLRSDFLKIVEMIANRYDQQNSNCIGAIVLAEAMGMPVESLEQGFDCANIDHSDESAPYSQALFQLARGFCDWVYEQEDDKIEQPTPRPNWLKKRG